MFLLALPGVLSQFLLYHTDTQSYVLGCLLKFDGVWVLCVDPEISMGGRGGRIILGFCLSFDFFFKQDLA